MCVRKYIAAVAICLCASSWCNAGDAVSMEVEQKLNTVQQAYAQLPVGQKPNVTLVQNSLPAPVEGPYFAPGTYVPPVTTETPYVVSPGPPLSQQPCEVCGVPDGCDCDAAWCRSGW